MQKRIVLVEEASRVQWEWERRCSWKWQAGRRQQQLCFNKPVSAARPLLSSSFGASLCFRRFSETLSTVLSSTGGYSVSLQCIFVLRKLARLIIFVVSVANKNFSLDAFSIFIVVVCVPKCQNDVTEQRTLFIYLFIF